MCGTLAKRFGQALFLFALSQSGPAVAASGGAAPSIAELVRQSKSILAGTVDRAWVQMDRRVHAPVVRVALRDIRAVKGSRRDRLVVTFWSRESGAPYPRREGAPEFRKGERYIVLSSEPLDDAKTGYTPIVAPDRCVFPVVYDPSLRRAFVHDWARRPIERIEPDRLVVCDATSSAPQATDPGTRVSEEEFLRVVRALLAERP